MGLVSSTERHDFDVVYSLVYEELRRLARHSLKHEYAAQVSPTTLVHEAWLKLARNPCLASTTPVHFRRMAARAMRQILIDAARHRDASMHGGDLLRVDLDSCLDGAGARATDRQILALHDALDTLERMSSRQAALVEARFFGGFSCDECAEIFGISEATVMRDWRAARAFLEAEISRTCPNSNRNPKDDGR